MRLSPLALSGCSGEWNLCSIVLLLASPHRGTLTVACLHGLHLEQRGHARNTGPAAADLLVSPISVQGILMELAWLAHSALQPILCMGCFQCVCRAKSRFPHQSVGVAPLPLFLWSPMQSPMQPPMHTPTQPPMHSPMQSPMQQTAQRVGPSVQPAKMSHSRPTYPLLARSVTLLMTCFSSSCSSTNTSRANSPKSMGIVKAPSKPRQGMCSNRKSD